MGRDSGRTNTPGNMKGAKKSIKIATKKPMIHLNMQKSK